MTFLEDLVLLGGTPTNSVKQQLFQILSICQIKTISHRINSLSIRQNQTELYKIEQLEYSSKPLVVLHSKVI